MYFIFIARTKFWFSPQMLYNTFYWMKCSIWVNQNCNRKAIWQNSRRIVLLAQQLWVVFMEVCQQGLNTAFLLPFLLLWTPLKFCEPRYDDRNKPLRNSLGNIQRLYNFLKASPKRESRRKNFILSDT